jgi:nitrite reductase (NADH) large subunit
MRIGIIGNGLAGVMAAKTLRESGFPGEVVIFAREKHHYYPRPNLIEFLAGNLPEKRLFAFAPEWYEARGLQVRLATPVRRILNEPLAVELEDGRKEGFDTLLLADGALSYLPPIQGVDRRGVFTLRTRDDAQAILDYLPGRRRATVLGGGLLGLETARALKARGAEVLVVEFFDRLLPRQLDAQGASLLKAQIEALGIRVRLGTATEEILGSDRIEGLRFKDGGTASAELAVVAAGVRPSMDLAREAGLTIDRGVVVDDLLRTSHPRIFAAGDNVQHQGRVYGIIPAAFEQAKAAALNILGQGRGYKGTIPSNTLKVVGMSVTSAGLALPEGQGFEELRREDAERGLYKKIVLQNGRLVGAIWMGTREGADQIVRASAQRLDVSQWKDALLQDGFDFSQIEK